MSDMAHLASSTIPSVEKSASSLDTKEAPENLTTVITTAEGLVLQKPKKAFSLLSAASLGYAITNSPMGVLLVVGNLVFGGSPLFFYGMFPMTIVSYSVAISLGELASAFPHAGGQYFWVAQIAPPSCRRFASYMTAIVSWASVVCIGASCCSGNVNVIFQLVAISYPEFEYKQWHGFLAFEAVNIFAFSFNLFERFLPAISKSMMLFSLATAAIFFVTLLAAPSPKASASDFFTYYYNISGWSNGVSFFIGISGLNWSFSCLDAVTHLSEEIPNPRKNIPKALLIAVTIGVVTAMMTIFAIYFAAYDISLSHSVVALLYLIYHENQALTLALGTLLLVSAWSSLIGIHTWQARIAWSLARDNGFPFPRRLATLAPAPFDTPIWAHLWSTTWIGLCGFLYLGSLTAFNSFVAGGIILQYLTYSTPVIFLLVKGRQNIVHGPFWLPRLGLVANIILVSWTLIALVFYSFPFFKEVHANDMNYLSAVLAIVVIYALGFWFVYGRKHFKLVDLSAIIQD